MLYDESDQDMLDMLKLLMFLGSPENRNPLKDLLTDPDELSLKLTDYDRGWLLHNGIIF